MLFANHSGIGERAKSLATAESVWSIESQYRATLHGSSVDRSHLRRCWDGSVLSYKSLALLAHSFKEGS
jgi:hypothetical protein